jgi:hypothetical protein
MRLVPNCECPTEWEDHENMVDCVEMPHPDGLNELIPSTPSNSTAAA